MIDTNTDRNINMDNNLDWFDQNAGGGEPSVYFGSIGDKVVGVITGTPRRKEMTNDNGKTSSVLIVPMRASGESTATKGKNGAEGRIAEGDEVALFVRAGFMAEAVGTAIRAAGGRGLTEGDTLAVAFSETKDTGKMQPAKKYQARYEPAKPAVDVASLV